MARPADRLLVPVLFLCSVGSVPVPAQFGGEDLTFFENEVRPLLAENCTRCHGQRRQRADLRLDIAEGVRTGGFRGPAVVPGDPEASVLIAAVRYTDEDLAMPPKGKLADEDIETLIEWVRRGAPLPEDAEGHAAVETETYDLTERANHWAFRPLSRADPSRGIDESIDEYVQARLEDAGLEPADQAEGRTLLRRLSFDLTGLPPDPAWLERNLQAPFETIVDELLASPHYGERWARHWLDLVRYAESRGHEFDLDIPNAYQYRDYVVRAFDRDVPYDLLVREHVAGDLLPSPRLDPDTGANESVLGTGFWFLGSEMHSPVDVRADETDRTADKIDVLSRAFLGLTVACARCHDHKFDAVSTEDYYALSGFVLGGSYRQVRFETMERNGDVAARLEALGVEHAPSLRRALGAHLKRVADDADDHLRAALAMDADPIGEVEGDVEIPTELDLLFDDFEREEFAPWTTTGTAYGHGPVAVAELPDYHDVRHHRGERVVTAHQARNGEDVREADEHTGALSSPPFVIERDYVHFLISGGSHEGTAVQLVVDGVIVDRAHGSESNAMSHARFDVRALRGRTAHLVAVDEHTGGWGHVGLDHVVFSDRPDAGALECELRPQDAARRALRTAEEARRFGVAPEGIEAWTRELDLARGGENHPLRPFVAERTAGGPETDAAMRVLVDYATLDPGHWLQDGFGFGSRPLRAGEATIRTDGYELVAESAAVWDPTWDVLELAADTQLEVTEPTWEQAGRTLRTPTFVPEHGRLFYRVRGAGHAFAAVDGHREVRGPLHTETVLSFEVPGDGFGWVEHDLRAFAGHRVHIEFSPRRRKGAASDLAVARLVEAERVPHAGGLARLDAMLRAGEPTQETLVERLDGALRAAADRFARGETLHAEDAGLLAWLASLARTPVELPREFVSARESLVREIRTVSHTAPAMLEGTGVDEFVLLRGNHETPGHVARRRYLEVFDGGEPLDTGPGSGRLALAERLTDPGHPLLARVWVNRLWHHLFGRGLVSSVDDFGRMGEAPSHPELLDHLAGRLIESGWSTKTVLREIVTSHTYRQSSRADPLAVEIDPDNLLLHHAPRRRLEGEAIRDAILAVSGGLRRELYGAPVPIHLTEFEQGRGRPAESGPVDGDGRRSLYLAVRRNFVTPFLQVFDYPPPATTMGRRGVSNVPAQALTLLNDPFVLGEARRWAERVQASEASDVERVTRMYLDAFGREPEPAELAEAVAFVGRGSADDPQVWADLCHVLYNLKEFVFLD